MHVKKIGTHNGPLAFLDMSGRFKPKVGGSVFRLGDRAAAHLWLLQWRRGAPDAKIVVIDDPFLNRKLNAAWLDPTWVFDGIADEIWTIEKEDEVIPKPDAHPLYHVNLWRIWFWLRRNKTVVPTIYPRADGVTRAAEMLKRHGVPAQYVTVQPLVDATYNCHRNAPMIWWRNIIHSLARVIPVVVLGMRQNIDTMLSGPNIFPLWAEDLEPMDSLALIHKARFHVGGETGLTLWAPLLHVPTIATYANWTEPGKRGADCRPISFRAPVMFSALNSPIDAFFKTAVYLLRETQR